MIIQAIHAYIYTNTHLLIHTMQKTKGEKVQSFSSQYSVWSMPSKLFQFALLFWLLL